MNGILVACGGAIGACLRYGAGIYFAQPQQLFPWATWIVNIVGCLCAGIFLAFTFKYPVLQQEVRLFLMVGILGGFTTFSSFGLETFQLLRSGHVSLALSYALSSLIVGMVVLAVGFYFCQLLLNIFLDTK